MTSQPPKLFISYAHEDKAHKERLATHLSGFVQRGIISSWHDGLIVPGQQWDAEIVKHLDDSRVVLLLIGPDFIASEYINRVELARAAERHARGEVIVIPVLVTNVHAWQAKSFGRITLGALQALPSDFRFVAEWDNPNAAYADIVKGIEDALRESERPQTAPARGRAAIPRPPAVGFVARRDAQGRDIVERLREELAPGGNALITLSGPGGMGKTTLAAEAARALLKLYGERFVWSSAARPGYFLSTLLDDTATQLGNEGLRTLAPEAKAAAVRALVGESPALLVVDNYETIQPAERNLIEEWFVLAQCSALFTSRQMVKGTRNVAVSAMPRDEAEQLLERLIAQTQDPQVFSAEVRQRIYETAEANPYLIEWVVAQINEAREPRTVFEELARGEGDAAERVFTRSFQLPQVGDDGRAALLALSLFARNATRPALAAAAGFGTDEKRLDAAVRGLHALGLVKGLDRYSRFTVEGLTRSLARAHLARHDHAAEFRRQFVAYFLGYALAHQQQTPEDYDALEAERENLLAAIDVAFEGRQWREGMTIYDALVMFLNIRGYWDEALQRGQQAVEAAHQIENKGSIAIFAGNIGIIRQNRGEYSEAQAAYSQSVIAFKELADDRNVSVGLYRLGMIAQIQGKVDEARRLYGESLEIDERLSDQYGIASTLHQLGMLAQIEGDTDEARRFYSESLKIGRRLGDQSGMAETLHQLGRLAQKEGNMKEARRLYVESLEIERRLGNQQGIAISLWQLGVFAAEQGDKAETVRLLKEALIIFDKLGSPEAESLRHDLATIEQ